VGAFDLSTGWAIDIVLWGSIIRARVGNIMTPEDIQNQILQQAGGYNKAVRFGQKKMLIKVLELVEQWEMGKYSNEEFAKVLKDIKNEIYAKNN